ncbi:MAG: protein translocase subunit SecF [bacterium]|nr:protein translocase subunit SecF [bacterium]
MTKYNFKIMEKKNLWFAISLIFILIGASLMTVRAFKSEPVLNYGIDFIGGSTMIFRFDELNSRYEKAAKENKKKQVVNIQFMKEIRSILKNFGLEKSHVQITQDKEVLIKTLHLDHSSNLKIRDELEEKMGALEVLEVDFIGPAIGKELKGKSLWIIFIVSIALLLYITWRFEFVFGISALIALIHDALITISFASIFNIEISTAFVAALLTVLGYSINDTIVVFDRVRENKKKLHKRKLPVIFLANLSINQTLIRTINTSATTLLVIGSLLVFGGTTIKTFCLVLFVGIAAGTYSSIFIASPALVALYRDDK